MSAPPLPPGGVHRDAPPQPAGAPRANAGRRRAGVVTLAVGVVALGLAFALALSVGSRAVPLAEVWRVLTGGSGSPEATLVVLDLRLPRSCIAVVAGIALGLAGALAQSLTRNPLADTGILGLNSGASFLIAVSVMVFGVSSPAWHLPFAFAGALAVAVGIFLIGGTGATRSSIARVTLAGMAIGAVLSGIVTALTLIDPAAYSVLRAWNAASLEGRTWAELLPALPFVAVGAVVALTLGASFNSLSLGEDLARSLGVDVGRVRVLALVAVTLLAGSATAIAGPIVFVGLMMPHLARAIVGPDVRWIMAITAVLSPVLVLAADVLGRVLLPNGEVPVGLVTAFLGAPVLIAIARRRDLVVAS
ncbi:iron chelate uptake ABC transporter family permease subunit [Rothia sp. AR01]|uniref:Iron chelate uptake ABC transporter family permease subunit n=1 Tax=Rothia santali TaxID=2949643 RepID=A0A9X2KH97_9MICC|nr:iron chelate uptake ABC transporter family permease subunit [Rothia santali]MCP3425647.1 iron chelate uptake ABC transporter family permease subunit [Rothia santali]